MDTTQQPLDRMQDDVGNQRIKPPRNTVMDLVGDVLSISSSLDVPRENRRKPGILAIF